MIPTTLVNSRHVFDSNPCIVELPFLGLPLPCGYTGTMEATTLVLLVLLDCLLVSSSRPFRSSSGGPPMIVFAVRFMQVSPAIRLSPVPGFPILPVLDYVPRLVLLDPRSPVSCPGFSTLPVPDYVPRLALLDPRSPVSCPGFRSCLSPTTFPVSSLWILVRLSSAPVSQSCLPPTILRPVPVDLLDFGFHSASLLSGA
ncbi:unnamed protein product [Boreogadus saida]